MNVKEIVCLLNHMHELCSSSVQGFTHAHLDANSISQRIVLDAYIGQRSQFAKEIENLLLGMGSHVVIADCPPTATPADYEEKPRSINATFNLLRERENTILREYGRALTRNLPPSIFIVLRTQFDEIKRLSHQLDMLSVDDVKIYDTPMDSTIQQFPLVG